VGALGIENYVCKSAFFLQLSPSKLSVYALIEFISRTAVNLLSPEALFSRKCSTSRPSRFARGA